MKIIFDIPVIFSTARSIFGRKIFRPNEKSPAVFG
jgi:hypothetical protein